VVIHRTHDQVKSKMKNFNSVSLVENDFHVNEFYRTCTCS
jgi:hypothetical protein